MRQNGCYTKEHHLYIAVLYMYLEPDIYVGTIWVAYNVGCQIETQAHYMLPMLYLSRKGVHHHLPIRTLNPGSEASSLA